MLWDIGTVGIKVHEVESVFLIAVMKGALSAVSSVEASIMLPKNQCRNRLAWKIFRNPVYETGRPAIQL